MLQADCQRARVDATARLDLKKTGFFHISADAKNPERMAVRQQPKKLVDVWEKGFMSVHYFII